MSANDTSKNTDPNVLETENYKEVTKLVTLLSSVDWEMKINLIQRNSGLPFGEELKEQDTKVSEDALAGSLGHETLYDFVTKTNEQLGLAMSWDDWETLVTKKIYQEKFNLFSTNHDEIISRVEEVTEYLGRCPGSSDEYYTAREEMLSKRFTDELEESKQQIKKLSIKAQSAQEKAQALSRDLEAAVSSKAEAIDNLRSDFVVEREILQEKVTADLNTRHTNAVNELKSRHSDSTIKLQEKMQRDLASFNTREEQSRANFSAIETKLNEQIIQLSDLAESEKKSNEEKENAIFSLNITVKDLQSSIDDKAIEISSLLKRCSVLEESAKKAEESHLKRMGDLSAQLDSEKGTSDQRAAEIVGLNDAVSELQIEISQREKELALLLEREAGLTESLEQAKLRHAAKLEEISRKLSAEIERADKLDKKLSESEESVKDLGTEIAKKDKELESFQDREDQIRKSFINAKEKMTAKIRDLKAGLDAELDNVESLRAELFDMKESEKEMLLDLEQKSGAIETMEKREKAERAKHASQESKLKGRIGDLESALDFEQGNNESRTNKIYALTEELNEANASLREKTHAIETMQQTIADLGEDIATARKNEAQAENEHNALVARLEKTIEEKGELVDGRDEDIQDLKAEISAKAEEIKSLRSEISKAKGEKNQLEIDITGLKNEINSRDSDITNLQNEIAEVQHKLKMKSDEVAAVKADLTKARDLFGTKQDENIAKIESLTRIAESERKLAEEQANQVALMKAEMASLQEHIDSQKELMDKFNADHLEEVKSLESAKSELSKSLHEAEKGLSASKKRADSRADKIEILEGQKQGLINELKDKEDFITQQESKFSKLHSAVDEKTRELEEAFSLNELERSKKLRAARQEANGLRRELEDLKAKHAEVSQRLEHQIANHNKTRSQLDKTIKSAIKTAATWGDDLKGYRMLIGLLSIATGSMFVANLAISAFALA